MEVCNVERILCTSLNRRIAEVVFVLPADHAGIGGDEHVDGTRSETANKVGVHRVLIDVKAKATHIDFADVRKISSATASSFWMSLSISSRLAW